MGSKSPPRAESKSSKSNVSSASVFCEEIPGLDHCCTPEFIYGGPFIKELKIEPFLDTITPINLQLQGTFKRSFAYYSLKERLPVILTKVIDTLSRKGGEDAISMIRRINKLKSDLMTNKQYDLLTEDSMDASKWNNWIEQLEQKRYYNNIWVFTECYAYRRLKEAAELTTSMKNFDPFAAQKDRSFIDSLEPMCIVAEKMLEMLPQSDRDKRKNDFITLLKLCLWSNKCDLSLTLGNSVTIAGGTDDGHKSNVTMEPPVLDPFQMIVDFKDKVLVDDTAKIADQVIAKAETMARAIEGASSDPSDNKGTPSKSPPGSPLTEDEAPEEKKLPCPAKMVVPHSVMFDIICDNAGYELFTDLCLAHFLIAQNIVQKVRFHVKNMPWFVSDVTPRDFLFVIDSCIKAVYNRSIKQEPKPATEGEAPSEAEPPRVISSEALQQLGQQWNEYVQQGTFLLMWEDYWTWPHCFKDMKKYDYNLYRKLQYPVALMFKGDLNYRKLLGEKNWNPTVGFETALQGFIPAPIIAVRTVKADLICGLQKGKAEQISKIDEKWMEKGDYGVIQFCPKAEPLKPSEKPCIDYGHECFGEVCPEHTDM